MKNYNRRNFLEFLKYSAFSHIATAMLYIAILSTAEQTYVEQGKTEEFNTILFLVSIASIIISAVVMLTAHHGNSEKKMNYLNATYEGGNEVKMAIKTALCESSTSTLALLTFQLPIILFFAKYGYGYHEALIFETLYIGDIGVYIFFNNSIIGALIIAIVWFIIYTLGVALFVAPIWNMGRIRKKGAPIKPEENPKDAYYRHTFKNTFKIFYALRKFSIAFLTALGICFIFSTFITALSKEISPTALRIIFGIFYVTIFYRIHGYRRDNSYFPHEKKFSFKKEVYAVWKEEVIYYLIIFIPLAIACEAFCFIYTEQNMLVSLLAFIFPFYGVINVPVLRSVVGIAWATIAALICITIKSAKQHRKVSRASKYRR